MPLERWSNNAATTLGAAIATTPAAGTQETWTLAATSMFPQAAGQTRLIVDSEILIATTPPASGTTISVTRGQEGTTPAAHANGATITQIVSAGSLSRLYDDSVISLADYPGWDSATPSVMTAARDLAAADAWSGTYKKMLEIPHHPTLAYYTWTTQFPYYAGMMMRGMGTGREFNGPSDIGMLYEGAGNFIAWPASGPTSQVRIENILFIGLQTTTTTSVFCEMSGTQQLEDVEFVDCAWKFFKKVIDAPGLRVQITGLTYINNGNDTQLNLKGSDWKILGEVYLSSGGSTWQLTQDKFVMIISLSMSEIDRVYVTPAPNMGVKFTGVTTGLSCRIVANGLHTAGPATYVNKAAFPAAASNAGIIAKATDTGIVWRSNGTDWNETFWDGVTPVAQTTAPTHAVGKMWEDTTDTSDAVRFYRSDGTYWYGPKFHPGYVTYDGADGPGVTFEDTKGSMDADIYVWQCGMHDFSTRVGAIAFVNNRDEISCRIDHDYLIQGKNHYDLRQSTSGYVVKARINDNLGRPHRTSPVVTPRINITGTVRLDHGRAKAQEAFRRPGTFETPSASTLATAAPAVGAMYVAPILSANGIDQLSIDVATLVASGVGRIVCYHDDGAGFPGALAFEGTVATTTTGVKPLTVALPPGRYWVGCIAQTAAATFRTLSGFVENVPLVAAGSATAWSGVGVASGITGAAPAAFPTTGLSNTANCVCVWYRAV